MIYILYVLDVVTFSVCLGVINNNSNAYDLRSKA